MVKDLKDEILKTASKRYPRNGYDQWNLLDVAFETIIEKIDDYKNNSENFCHDCAKQNLDDIKYMLKEGMKVTNR